MGPVTAPARLKQAGVIIPEMMADSTLFLSGLQVHLIIIWRALLHETALHLSFRLTSRDGQRGSPICLIKHETSLGRDSLPAKKNTSAISPVAMLTSQDLRAHEYQEALSNPMARCQRPLHPLACAGRQNL